MGQNGVTYSVESICCFGVSIKIIWLDLKLFMYWK